MYHDTQFSTVISTLVDYHVSQMHLNIVIFLHYVNVYEL